MWCEQWQSYVDLLQQQVVPALGCTEPVSTALAVAQARELLGELPQSIEVKVSANLLKNGMGVGIPGTGETGLAMAAAIGAIAGDAEAGLQVLQKVTKEDVHSAKALLSKGAVSVALSDDPALLYCEVIASNGENQARVVIRDYHTNIVLKQRNQKIVFQQASDQQTSEKQTKGLSITSIYRFATEADLDKLEFIAEAADLNCQLSEEGLARDYGLKVGKTLQNNLGRGWLSEDFSVLAMMRASAASDARMDGAMLPAMSNSGSGNQGIAATMPVVAVAEKINASHEQLIRALILSHLTAIHIKQHLNILSALCGATTAGTGAAAGITWLLDGDLNAVENAIFNMVGDISGIFCDGAKNSCSMKVSTAASAAVKSSLMALDGIRITGQQGIVEDDLEKTIDNLGLIGSQAMQETDKMIVQIMANK